MWTNTIHHGNDPCLPQNAVMVKIKDLHAETYLRKLKNNYILWSWGKYLHSWHTYTTQRINPQGAKIHASTTPCEYTCWPGVIGFPTILEYIHSINTTNGLIGVYTFLHTNTLFVCWLPPMHATMASILRLLCLIPPRLLLSHSQAAIASFPGCCCLIPRLPLPHSQAAVASFPGCHCLIPRLSLPHSQAAIVSFPGCYYLIQGNTVAVHHKDQKGF